MPAWHVYRVSPALNFAGCSLVGGLFDVLRLKQIDERLCFPVRAAALQGERVRVCAMFYVTSCLAVFPFWMSPWVLYRVELTF
jgi:hypothetical protein